MNVIRKSWIFCLPAFVLVWTFAGCGPTGPTKVPVTGTVMLDSKPVEGATVSFQPEEKGTPVEAITDASGEFTVGGGGALEGKYKVSVSKIEETGAQGDPTVKDQSMMLSGPPSSSSGPSIKWLTPQKYATPGKSGLTADVKVGMEPLKYELSSK